MKSSAKPDYGKIALIVIIVVIVIAVIAGLVYYFTKEDEASPARAGARDRPSARPSARAPSKKPYVFMPPLFRRRPQPKIIQPKVDVKVSTNKKKINSNRAINLGLGYMLGASNEKMKEQQTEIEDLKCKQLHGSKSRYNPYTQLCETDVDNAVSGNLIPSLNGNNVQTQPATNISGNGVSSTEPVNLQTQPSNNLSNMNTVVNNLTNVSGDVPVIGIQNNARQVVEDQTQNTYNNRRGSFVFDTEQGNFQVNNTHKDLIDIISNNNEHDINNGYVNSGNNITVLPPDITSFEGSTNGNLSYTGMDNSTVNGGIQNNLAVNGSGN